MSTIKIQLKKSPVGKIKKHRDTVEALGFKRVGQIVEKQDTPQIRGMIRKIDYMVEVLD